MPEPLKLQDIKLRMQAYGVRPRRRHGQNLLADFNLLKAIVADAEVGTADCVLEIGTGAGSLTAYLCGAAGCVISVELDAGMFALSRDILHDARNLVQLRMDALDSDGRGLNPMLLEIVRKYLALGELPRSGPFALASGSDAEVHSRLDGVPPSCDRLKLVANLPYSVATSVVIGALESGLAFERLVVMLQFEVAEKLAAAPGQHAWGLPSLLVSRFATGRILRRVPSRVFWPRPKVDSALLELRPHAARPDMEAYERLRRFAHLLFQHRRKAALNSLAMALDVTASRAGGWISEAGGDPGARAEDLDPEVLQRLADEPEIEALSRKALGRDEEQQAAKEEKRARREKWKRRIYGDGS
jgi:16S rRNA (adenine1518-N6/adenine1519-N6)-dimethyltransferase